VIILSSFSYDIIIIKDMIKINFLLLDLLNIYIYITFILNNLCIIYTFFFFFFFFFKFFFFFIFFFLFFFFLNFFFFFFFFYIVYFTSITSPRVQKNKYGSVIKLLQFTLGFRRLNSNSVILLSFINSLQVVPSSTNFQS